MLLVVTLEFLPRVPYAREDGDPGRPGICTDPSRAKLDGVLPELLRGLDMIEGRRWMGDGGLRRGD